jgi:hypothetical protein
MATTSPASEESPQAAATKPPPKARRPPSEERLRANSVNSIASTGPRTTTGKAVSALNGVKHGMTSNKIMFLEGEIPEEYFDEVNRWAVALNAVTEPEYALVELAVYNMWKLRRARNAAAVAVNKMSRRIKGMYYQNQNERVRQLTGQIDYNARVVVGQLQEMTGGLHWLAHALEGLALILMKGGTFDSANRARLINLLGLMPYSLFIDRDVMQIELGCLSLEYGKGNLTAVQAAELLEEARGERPLEEFARGLEPHLSSMVTKDQARQYLMTTINKRLEALNAHLPTARAREAEAIAEEVALARSDISDTGYRREQYQAMANSGRRGALRDLHVMQDDRRKFGAGDPEDNPEPHEEPRDDAGQSAAQDPQTAPVAAAVPAAENPVNSKANVPQADGQVQHYGAGTIQSDHPGTVPSGVGAARIDAMVAAYLQRLHKVEQRE